MGKIIKELESTDVKSKRAWKTLEYFGFVLTQLEIVVLGSESYKMKFVEIENE